MLQASQYSNIFSDWVPVILCHYPLLCMYLIVVDVGIVSNVICTYACIIYSPMSACMFAVLQTWREYLESNSLNRILLVVVIPPPHNGKVPSHRTMVCMELYLLICLNHIKVHSTTLKTYKLSFLCIFGTFLRSL